jgi:hypothetical protein
MQNHSALVQQTNKLPHILHHHHLNLYTVLHCNTTDRSSQDGSEVTLRMRSSKTLLGKITSPLSTKLRRCCVVRIMHTCTYIKLFCTYRLFQCVINNLG